MRNIPETNGCRKRKYTCGNIFLLLDKEEIMKYISSNDDDADDINKY